MTRRRERTPADVKRHALNLLKSGKVSLPELAEVMGVSTHMLWNWCRLKGVDWRTARQRAVAAEWRKVNR